MKVNPPADIKERQAVIAREEYNVKIAIIFFAWLATFAIEHYFEGYFDRAAVVALGLSLPAAQIIGCKYRIWKHSPENLEIALGLLKQRKVRVLVNGNSTGKLASLIRSQCNLHNHEVQEVEWLLSAVTPRAKSVTIDIAQEITCEEY